MISVGVFGFGNLTELWPFLGKLTLYLGIIFLTLYGFFSFKSALISSIARVIIGPIIGFIIIKTFNLSGFAAGVLLIQCSMPSAVLTYLVGSLYSSKKVVNSIASTIVMSTIVSFLTIPIIVFISLRYFF